MDYVSLFDGSRVLDLENGSPLQYPRRLYKYVKYGYSAALPEALKAPPEQGTLLHNLIRIGLKVLTNRVCVCADDEFWRGSKGGKSRRKL